MKREKLPLETVREWLGMANGWSLKEDAIIKRYEFTDFAKSLAFVNEVGAIAEAADHHPDITFGYGYAELVLTTHDRGGITDLDLAVADQIDRIATNAP